MEHVIPDTVNGLPVHPLAVHATVVLVPLAALLGVIWVVPALRRWARWPLALVSVGAAASIVVSIASGEHLEEVLQLGSPVAELIERHEELAEQLRLIVFAYAVVAVLAAILVKPRERDKASPGDRHERTSTGNTVLALVFSVVLVVGAVAMGVQTYRVGDAGAKAVWNPTGDVSYSD